MSRGYAIFANGIDNIGSNILPPPPGFNPNIVTTGVGWTGLHGTGFTTPPVQDDTIYGTNCVFRPTVASTAAPMDIIEDNNYICLFWAGGHSLLGNWTMYLYFESDIPYVFTQNDAQWWAERGCFGIPINFRNKVNQNGTARYYAEVIPQNGRKRVIVGEVWFNNYPGQASYVDRHGRAIYVDGDNGNDTTGTGTSAAPFKTINKGIVYFGKAFGGLQDTSATRRKEGGYLYVKGTIYEDVIGPSTERKSTILPARARPWPGLDKTSVTISKTSYLTNNPSPVGDGKGGINYNAAKLEFYDCTFDTNKIMFMYAAGDTDVTRGSIPAFVGYKNCNFTGGLRGYTDQYGYETGQPTNLKGITRKTGSTVGTTLTITVGDTNIKTGYRIDIKTGVNAGLSRRVVSVTNSSTFVLDSAFPTDCVAGTTVDFFGYTSTGVSGQEFFSTNSASCFNYLIDSTFSGLNVCGLALIVNSSATFSWDCFYSSVERFRNVYFWNFKAYQPRYAYGRFHEYDNLVTTGATYDPVKNRTTVPMDPNLFPDLYYGSFEMSIDIKTGPYAGTRFGRTGTVPTFPNSNIRDTSINKWCITGGRNGLASNGNDADTQQFSLTITDGDFTQYFPAGTVFCCWNVNHADSLQFAGGSGNRTWDPAFNYYFQGYKATGVEIQPILIQSNTAWPDAAMNSRTLSTVGTTMTTSASLVNTIDAGTRVTLASGEYRTVVAVISPTVFTLDSPFTTNQTSVSATLSEYLTTSGTTLTTLPNAAWKPNQAIQVIDNKNFTDVTVTGTTLTLSVPDSYVDVGSRVTLQSTYRTITAKINSTTYTLSSAFPNNGVYSGQISHPSYLEYAFIVSGGNGTYTLSNAFTVDLNNTQIRGMNSISDLLMENSIIMKSTDFIVIGQFNGAINQFVMRHCTLTGTYTSGITYRNNSLFAMNGFEFTQNISRRIGADTMFNLPNLLIYGDYIHNNHWDQTPAEMTAFLTAGFGGTGYVIDPVVYDSETNESIIGNFRPTSIVRTVDAVYTPFDIKGNSRVLGHNVGAVVA